MMKTCMDTCGWCGEKGCVDEFPDECPQWAKEGLCSQFPNLLVHTCRESCGSCGLLSSDSKEEQRIGKQTFTNISNETFTQIN